VKARERPKGRRIGEIPMPTVNRSTCGKLQKRRDFPDIAQQEAAEQLPTARQDDAPIGATRVRMKETKAY